MSKKYELTEEVMEYEGVILHRIRALKDFGDVKKGDLGGWIKSEENLSQEGLCWVYVNAEVHGNAKVYGNAEVYGRAKVFENAEVFGNANIYDNAEVFGNAKVHGTAKVFGNARVFGNAMVFNNAKVSGNAEVFGDAKVYGNAKVYGIAKVSGNARVFNNAKVFTSANVYVDAEITNPTDYIVIGPIGSRNDCATFYKTKDNNIHVVCGCFNGTLEEFEARVKETHKEDKYEKAYLNAIAFVKKNF